MAKSKFKFSLTAVVTLVTGILGFVMFFLPNLYYGVKTLAGTETGNASGLDMFLGVFSLDNANDMTLSMFIHDANITLSGIEYVYNALAYIIGILFVLAALCLIACAVLSALKLFGVNVNYDLVRILAMVATALLVIALVLVLIRFGQIANEDVSLSLGYGLIVGLIASIATAVVPMVLKD